MLTTEEKLLGSKKDYFWTPRRSLITIFAILVCTSLIFRLLYLSNAPKIDKEVVHLDDSASLAQRLHELIQLENELFDKFSNLGTGIGSSKLEYRKSQELQDSRSDVAFFVSLPIGETDYELLLKKLRDLIGSIHMHRGPSTPIIVVFGWRIPEQYTFELSLWRNVEYRDIESTLLPSSVQYDVIATPEELKSWRIGMDGTDGYWRKSLFDWGLKRFGRCIWLDFSVRFETREGIQRVLSALFDRGEVFIPKTATPDSESPSLPSPLIEGYVIGSDSYQLHIVSALKCLRGIRCSAENIRNATLGPENSAKFYSIITDLKEESSGPRARNGFYCYIDFRDDLMYSVARKTPKSLDFPQKDAKREIAIGVPTVSRGLQKYQQSSLLRTFFPSFVKSIQPVELELFTYRVYVGYDAGDEFLDSEMNRTEFASLINEIIAPLKSCIAVEYVRLPYSNAWLTFVWNSLFVKAIEQGADYFYQVNDDLDMQTPGWSSSFVHYLEKKNGYGVIGPNDPVWNCRLLTQAFVSRRHYEIFGWLYPIQIKDWYSDFFLTQVYGADMHCPLDIVARNLREKGSRYQLCNKPRWKEAVAEGIKVLILEKESNG